MKGKQLLRSVAGAGLLPCLISKAVSAADNKRNIRRMDDSSPVIGIMTQPLQDSNSTMIAASYVKWIEAGGARSIPIPYDATPDEVQEIFQQVNGVLFTGGAADLPQAAVTIWKEALYAYNHDDDFFPIWGTCLGFEWLLELGSGDPEILQSGFLSENISLPLETVDQYHLYKPQRIHEIVTKNNITMNNHHQGITPEQFSSSDRLKQLWRITSTNHDLSGRQFVSSIEPNDPLRLPIYGVQYHPEKNTFEYATYPGTDIPYEAINHSKEGIEMSMYLAQFFVDLARQNNHQFTQPDTYPLMYTYPVKEGVKFEQIFVIPPSQQRPAGSSSKNLKA